MDNDSSLEKIYTQRPSLPNLNELNPYLKDIWKSKWLSNNGKYTRLLESKLSEYLDVPYISLVANGTSGLLIALKALEIKGEVITTPFSYVATANSILWNNAKPIFVDIEKDGFNIDPIEIEKSITDQTSAILAVHCYGFPCQVERIKQIAIKYNLKVIYDAAHAFAVKMDYKSLLIHGDLSILSFHATKVFTTIEGGAIISNNLELKEKIDKYIKFGFGNNEDDIDFNDVDFIGINAKMNEIQSALGLVQLRHIDNYLISRKRIYNNYCSTLKNIKGIRIIKYNSNTTPNYSYMPILIEESCSCSVESLYKIFIRSGILVRRYFYPIIPKYNAYKKMIKRTSSLNNANLISQSVICLPINPTLKESQQNKILDLIKKYCI